VIVTIDGPAGSGKSTAARKLAALLEWPYLDTGAMYRAVALRALQKGISPGDAEGLAEAAREAEIDLDCGPTHVRVRLDRHDVTERIRSLEVSQATSAVAQVQKVREILIDKQREIARRLGSIITEGRDQGSVVFPDAEAKFFLDASLQQRAERRYHELAAEGESVTLEQVRENLALRDDNDARQWAPLLADPKVIRVETDGMTIGQVVDYLADQVRGGG
jgi:CMP/dCMP kinase